MSHLKNDHPSTPESSESSWVDRVAAATLWFALAAVIVAVGFRFLGPASGSVSSSASVSPGMPPEQFAAMVADGQWIGPRTAPAVLIVYGDYRCGFCGQLETSLELLRARYPQHLAVVYKHFVDPSLYRGYLVPHGAECASEQGEFEQFHIAAFSNTEVLDYSESWQNIAEIAGISDLRAYRECVLSMRYAGQVAEHYSEGVQLGVTGTPGLLFSDGELMIGLPPFDRLEAQIVRQFTRRL